jgi:enoyl-CoA hydratase
MLHAHVRVEETSLVTRWTIDRPARGNGLGPSVIAHLAELLGELKQTLQFPRALVVTASPVSTRSRRVWIAGGDLKELSTLESAESAYLFAHAVSLFLQDLAVLPIPVVMVIDGEAIGGGAEFALGGDIRIATQGSFFDFKQVQMGLATGFGGAHRLSQLVGLTRAESLIYGAQRVSALEARDIGLIHDVAEDAQGLNQLLQDWIQRLVSIEATAFAAQKKMFYLSRSALAENVRQREAQLFSEIWNNPVHRSRVQEFLNKSTKSKDSQIKS